MSHAHGGALPWLAPLLAALAVAVYLAAAWPRSNTRRPWPLWRSASWTLGVALVWAAFAPTVATHAHHDLRAHMLQHILLGMLGPLALALGAPITLALRTLPPQPARLLVALLHSPPLRLLAHPVSAALLNVGGMALLYLTPLFGLALHTPALHLLVHVHFLLAGYLFAWAILGHEPAARPAPWLVRLAVLFVAAGLHAALAKALVATGLPAGTPGDELLAAAQLMYYGGDIAEILLAVALFAQWYRRRPAPSAVEAVAATHSAAP